MVSTVFADGLLYTTSGGRTLWHAMPLLLGALCALVIAYRYYSAFLAAKVLALNDSRPTPAHLYNDGQNYHPTNKWVLFGHHFAAISGAGPLIGPVLAIQYGYMPGLLWLVIGVCLAGAVQDMLVLAASVRHGGKSLAEIARAELGPWARLVVSAAILFIVVIALAGLGFVVVKALGGEEITLAEGIQITLPQDGKPELRPHLASKDHFVFHFPGGCKIKYPGTDTVSERPEGFLLEVPSAVGNELSPNAQGLITLPAGCSQLVRGSSWGVFTIACTIPIALFVGLYMYRIRKGRVVEASLIGAVLVLAATWAGSLIPGSALEAFFSLTKTQTVLALTIYGFIASVLPVWLLLCPRDYLSSFLKIGTIALLVIGVFLANPTMKAPPLNEVFQQGGPTFPGKLFPFVFICIMCGSISGFHALVSSGTTPKMVDKESQVRPIGYGAMLMEGLVGIVALIAAASLDPKLYYDINVAQDKTAKWQPALDKLYRELGNVDDPSHLPVERAATGEHNLDKVEQMVQESLRGRTGGAVTLAVGMSFVLKDAMHWAVDPNQIDGLMKFWFHFAIMFEALFILTTIDTGTRIARFLLQEALGAVYRPFEKTDWLPGAVLSTFLVTAAWGVLVYTGSIDTIWPMFGIANQLLAVVALALVTTWLINTGRGRFAPLTILPMLFVTATTMTAATEMTTRVFPDMIRSGAPVQVIKGLVSLPTTIFVIVCVMALLLLAIARWLAVLRGVVPTHADVPAGVGLDIPLDKVNADIPAVAPPPEAVTATDDAIKDDAP